MGHTATVSVFVWVLTALGCVVVVLTRVRLGARNSGGRRVSPLALAVHTSAGALAVVSWTVALVTGSPTVGFVGLTLWWVTTVAGLALLLRWAPSRGRHADDEPEDAWVAGRGLSVLAHVGMLLGVLVFTYAYAVGVV